MQTQILFRHTDGSGRLRSHAEAELDKLTKVYAHIDGALVTFTEDGLTKKAEVRLNVPGHDPVCTEQGASHEEALDRCVASLRRALLKRKEQARSHDPARDVWH